MPTSRSPKNARLDLRMTEDAKALVEEAARLLGVSVTDFVSMAAQKEATRTLRERAEVEVIRLNRAESLRLAEALIAPPEPNEALRHLMREDARARGR